MRALILALFVLLAALPARAQLDVNAATADELERLPGIGPTKARAIVEERDANGAYESLDDLKRVKGIGKATIEKLRAVATVGGATSPSPSPSPATAPANAPEPELPSPPRRREPVAEDPDAEPEHKPLRVIIREPPQPDPTTVTPPGALDAEPPHGKVNLNLATEDDLQALDGVSRANAKIILAWRQVKGPFRSVSDLSRVPGLPPRLFQTVQYFVTVRSDANGVTEAQLIRLGFEPSVAGAIIVHRRKSGGLRSAADLERLDVLSATDRERARAVLWFEK